MLGAFLIASAYIAFSRSAIYEAAYEDYAAASAKADAERDLKAGCQSSSSVNEALECAKNYIDTARDTQHAEEDLQAQKQMANWAYFMVWIAWFSFIVSAALTGLGIVYVRRTLVAALEGNTISREAFIAERRPWLKIQDVSIKSFYIGKLNASLSVEVAFENTGNSPATNVGAYVDLLLAPVDQTETTNYFDKLRSGWALADMIVFPQTNDILKANCMRPVSEILEANEKVIAGFRDFGVPSEADRLAKRDPPIYLLYVFAGVRYQFYGSKTVHQTSVWGALRQIDPDDPKRFAVEITRRNFPLDTVRIERYGTYAD